MRLPSSSVARGIAYLMRRKTVVDLLSSLGLGLMSVIVSFAAVVISWKQTALTERQAIVAEQQLLVQKTELSPRLRIDVELTKDEAGDFYVTETYRVFNDGGPLYDFRREKIVFLKIEKTRTSPKYRREEFFFPVLDYYNTSFGGNAQVGQIHVGTGANNNDWFHKNFYFPFLHDEKPEDIYYEVTILRFLDISYKNMFGETIREMYQLEHWGGTKVSEDNANKYRDLYAAAEITYSMDNLTKAIVMEEIAESFPDEDASIPVK